MAGVIVLDASLLIAFLDRDDAQHTLAEDLLTREIDNDFVANPLTLAEVLVVPVRDGRLEEVQAALADLEVEETPFPAATAVKLAHLRADTGLKMPDCCVLLAADTTGAARIPRRPTPTSRRHPKPPDRAALSPQLRRPARSSTRTPRPTSPTNGVPPPTSPDTPQRVGPSLHLITTTPATRSCALTGPIHPRTLGVFAATGGVVAGRVPTPTPPTPGAALQAHTPAPGDPYEFCC